MSVCLVANYNELNNKKKTTFIKFLITCTSCYKN